MQNTSQIYVQLIGYPGEGFDYLLPPHMQTEYKTLLGRYVRVPFGKREKIGIIWAQDTTNAPREKCKEVLEVLHHLPPLQASMCHFVDSVARYTMTPTGLVLKLVVPVDAALEHTKSRRKLLQHSDAPPHIPSLSYAQQQAADSLTNTTGYCTIVLEGVTGSGKTEVYNEAIAAVLKRGKQALVLLPEIALTSAWEARAKVRFGRVPLIWHSGQTPASRRDAWRSIAKGEAQLIAGARSALFLPYPDLEVIIVDEEHDSSYKQEEGVNYHGRDMAVLRAQHEQALCVLASATPSLESRENAKIGRYQHILLSERFSGVQMPHMQLIDMRKHPPAKDQVLSPAVYEAIEHTLQQGKQVLVFINRRGYAPVLICHACGAQPECPDCSVTLTWHKKRARLQCHFCEYHQPVPEACPACNEPALQPYGIGIERLEEELRAVFPERRLCSLSSDSHSPTHMQEWLEVAGRGEVDILIGTQLLAKGHHFPHLHLVVIADGTLGLHGADPRASERAYALLTQVSGRAGREQQRGHVLIQSWQPEHPLLAALMAGEADQLIELDRNARMSANMPPFSRLIAIIVDGFDEMAAHKHAVALARALHVPAPAQLLGPAPAPLFRLRQRYRFRLLLISPKQMLLQPVIAEALRRCPAKGSVRVRVDVDPLHFG